MAETIISPELKALDVEHVKAYLTQHPHIASDKDASRPYEVAVVKLIDANTAWNAENVAQVMNALIKPDNKETPAVAYAAYYALCTYYRRNKNVKEYNQLIKTAPKEFTQRDSYPFLALMCEKMLNPNDWRLLARAEKLCSAKGLKENYGVKHCFAEYVAGACENDPTRISFIIKEYMESALQRVTEAIAESEDTKQTTGDENGEQKCENKHAKFYVTLARLNNIKAIHFEDESCFRLSQSQIEEAIEKEDDSTKRNVWQSMGVQMRSEYYAKTLEKKIAHQEESIQQQFHENNVKNLEFLSFFSAIVGLLVAGIQVTLNMEFRQAATLLVALVGCMITAFGAIGFILHSKWQRWIVNAVIVIIGVALLVLAMRYGAKHAL